jgi:tetratricopeptide (TPR) repeat protein
MKSSITRDWALRTAKECGEAGDVDVSASRPRGRALQSAAAVARSARRWPAVRAIVEVAFVVLVVVMLIVGLDRQAALQAEAAKDLKAAVAAQSEKENAQKATKSALEDTAVALKEKAVAEASLKELKAQIVSLKDEVSVLEAHVQQLQKAADPREQVAERIRTTLADRPPSERADMLWRRGIDRMNLREYGNAEFFFREALKEVPQLAPAFLGIGDVQSREGNYAEAVSYYDKAIALDHQYKAAFLNKAWALTHATKYDDAERAANEALKIDPSYAPAMEVFEAIKQAAPNRPSVVTPRYVPASDLPKPTGP